MLIDSNKETAFVSVVIYVYNKEDLLKNNLPSIFNYFESKFSKYEIILVDNRSSDGSVEIIKDIAKDYENRITLVELSSKSDQESAIQVGIELAIGDFVFEVDSVGSLSDMGIFAELYKKCQEGNDVVAAVANNKKVFSNFFHRMLEMITNVDIHIDTDVVKIVTRRALNAASKIYDKTRYRKIIYQMIGYNYATITYRTKDKVSSIETFRDKVNMFIDVAFAFSNFGIKLNIFLSSLFFLFSIVGGGYAIFVYFTHDKVISGWATIMAFLSLGFSGLFVVLGVLSKYLSMILKEVRTIPSSVVKNITRL